MLSRLSRLASLALYGEEHPHPHRGEGEGEGEGDGEGEWAGKAAELIGRMDTERAALRAQAHSLLHPSTERSDRTDHLDGSSRRSLSLSPSLSLPSGAAREATQESGHEGGAPPLVAFSSWLADSLSRQANKRMRRLVGQSVFTNRFLDPGVEESFSLYLMHHQLKYVQRAMLALGGMLLLAAIYQAALLRFEHDSMGAGGVLQGGVSMMIVADEHALDTHVAVSATRPSKPLVHVTAPPPRPPPSCLIGLLPTGRRCRLRRQRTLALAACRTSMAARHLGGFHPLLLALHSGDAPCLHQRDRR